MRMLRGLLLAGILVLVAAVGACIRISPVSAAGDPPPAFTQIAGPGLMDLLAGGLDPNGLLLSPYSRYQHDNNALPNVDSLCQAGDCTSQKLSFDTAQYGT